MISTWYKFSYPQLEDPSHLPLCANGMQGKPKLSKHHISDRTGKHTLQKLWS